MEKTASLSQSNRRRSQRRKPRGYVKVECRAGSYGLGTDLAVAVLDLSDKGIRMIIRRTLDLGAEVEITIGGYGLQKPLKRVAKLRWQVATADGQSCVGIEFDKRIDHRDWQMLASPR
jgi:hypothetical protein